MPLRERLDPRKHRFAKTVPSAAKINDMLSGTIDQPSKYRGWVDAFMGGINTLDKVTNPPEA